MWIIMLVVTLKELKDVIGTFFQAISRTFWVFATIVVLGICFLCPDGSPQFYVVQSIFEVVAPLAVIGFILILPLLCILGIIQWIFGIGE